MPPNKRWLHAWRLLLLSVRTPLLEANPQPRWLLIPPPRSRYQSALIRVVQSRQLILTNFSPVRRPRILPAADKVSVSRFAPASQTPLTARSDPEFGTQGTPKNLFCGS